MSAPGDGGGDARGEAPEEVPHEARDEAPEGEPAPRRLRTSVELFVSDVDRSIAWYGLLGFAVARRWQDWARLVRPDGPAIILQGDGHVVEGPHYFTPAIGRFPRGTGVEIVVEVADVDALYADATAGGVEVVKVLMDRPWGARDFRAADPDGYFLRFTSPRRAP